MSDLLIAEEFETRHAEPVPRNSLLVPRELAVQLPEEVETVDMQPGGDIVEERQKRQLTQQKSEQPKPAKADEPAIPDDAG